MKNETIKSDALSELYRLAEACSKDNWDGYGSLKVDPLSVRHTEEFLRALPDDFPLPELAPEPDGSISLDWIRTGRYLFSFSIGPSDGIAYAGMPAPITGMA